MRTAVTGYVFSSEVRTGILGYNAMLRGIPAFPENCCNAHRLVDRLYHESDDS